MRWVVERTLAWLNRCHRLAKDFENLTDNALAFLRLASIRLMLRRLCNPSWTFRTDSDFRHAPFDLDQCIGTSQTLNHKNAKLLLTRSLGWTP
jgi:hypothetical protein